MPEKDNGQDLAKAGVFFERADKAGLTDNFDDAIDMYIEALRCAPDAVEDGHIKLRELALRRRMSFDQKPPAAEKIEYLPDKPPLEQMLNAEYHLAQHPSHLPYAEIILKAAVAGGYKKTVKWIADLMFLANKSARKPSLEIYLLLKDSYKAVDQLDRAAAACRYATRLKPDAEDLLNELKNLIAECRVSRGKSDQEKVVEIKDSGLPEIEELKSEKSSESTPEKDDAETLAKAKVFFERARKVAGSDNFDYAIDMYIEGLRCAPDALEDGHVELRQLALRRQVKGGKKPSMVEKAKRMRGRTPLEQMINAEYLLAKDPDHLPYAEAILKAALAGNYKKTARWFADLLFQANNAVAKPSLQTYLLLKDSYEAIGQLDRALAACQWAIRVKPEDAELAEEFQRLSAEMTVAKGKYDQEGDFRKSIKDRQAQEKLQAQDRVVKTRDYRLLAVEEARKVFAQDPNLPQNIFNLANALSDLQNDQADDEAIELLENAYKAKKDFSFEQRAGQIQIMRLKRMTAEAETALEAKPDEAQIKSQLLELTGRLRETELEHYRLCVENYPTDLRAKYEYGIRLFRDKQYDKAIPFFQDAQKEPQHRISAMDKTGLCFFMKGWFADAIDVFTRAIDSHAIKDDGIAKELRYNLARCYEESGDGEKALEVYRGIAQLDFAYKDVRQRIDKLRASPDVS